ncbi:hypothetical protein L3V83_00200 [Thiotrichales bacterium 19X7-9]|nr:hypothetical protein [Thiotrichales bacterium 19X7-9]
MPLLDTGASTLICTSDDRNNDMIRIGALFTCSALVINYTNKYDNKNYTYAHHLPSGDITDAIQMLRQIKDESVDGTISAFYGIPGPDRETYQHDIATIHNELKLQHIDIQCNCGSWILANPKNNTITFSGEIHRHNNYISHQEQLTQKQEKYQRIQQQLLQTIDKAVGYFKSNNDPIKAQLLSSFKEELNIGQLPVTRLDLVKNMLQFEEILNHTKANDNHYVGVYEELKQLRTGLGMPLFPGMIDDYLKTRTQPILPYKEYEESHLNQQTLHSPTPSE